MGIQDMLDRDTLMADVEEVRDLVANNFDSLESIIMLWEIKGGVIHHRAYGDSSYLIGLLEKAKYVILRKEVGETRDKHEEENEL